LKFGAAKIKKLLVLGGKQENKKIFWRQGAEEAGGNGRPGGVCGWAGARFGGNYGRRSFPI